MTKKAKTIRVVLDLTVEDFTREMRREIAHAHGCEVDELPTLDEVSAYDIGNLFDDMQEIARLSLREDAPDEDG